MTIEIEKIKSELQFRHPTDQPQYFRHLKKCQTSDKLT